MPKTIYIVFYCDWYDDPDKLIQAFSTEEAANKFIYEQESHRYYSKECQLD